MVSNRAKVVKLHFSVRLRVDQQTLAWSLIIVLLAMMPLLDTSEQANSVTNALMLAVGLFAGRTIQGPRLGGMA